MYMNKQDPPFGSPSVQRQSIAPPLPPRKPNLRQSAKHEAAPSPLLPPVQALNWKNCDVEDTAQVEVPEETEAGGKISTDHLKSTDQPLKLYLNGVNVKYNGTSNGIGDKLNLFEKTFTPSISPRASVGEENISSNYAPPKHSSICEPLYEEIAEKEEDANDIINELEPDSETSNSRLHFAEKQIAWVKPFQLDEHSNHLLSNKLVGIKRKNTPDKEIYSPELAFIIKDMKEKEVKYIKQLENALLISRERVPQATRDKIFGYFQEIHTFHKTKFLFELNRSKIPKEFVYSFVKHSISFNYLYIQKEWQFSSNFYDANGFDNYIIENQDLKPYINFPAQRLSEYARSLECFQSICEKNKDRDTRMAAEKTISVMKNLEYQIHIVQEFKKLFEQPERFKESGEVFLIENFKIRINGRRKRISLLVYLCENMIIFADTLSKGRYKCVDVILTSLTYCRVLKDHKKFEVGVRGRNSFNLASASQSVKDLWCKKLSAVINEELIIDV